GRPMVAGTLLVLAFLSILVGCAGGSGQGARPSADAAETRTAHHLEAIRGDPIQLAMFLRRMPKGGDLHNHLSGAIHAASYMAWAAADGLCVDRRSYAFAAQPCRTAAGTRPAADALRDPVLYSAILAALSMRDFIPGSESGHDHFFATFGKFGL